MEIPVTEHSSHSLVPVYSQEMTLQAHFTFTSPMSGPKTVSSDPSTVAASSVKMTPKVFTGKEDSWHWNKEGAECSVICNPRGLSMKYGTATIPTCDAITLSNRQGNEQTNSQNFKERQRKSSPRKDDVGDTRRSSGYTLPHRQTTDGNPKTNRVHVARPYERRCKSTAQIVLQNNSKTGERRSKEFHGSTQIENSVHRHSDAEDRSRESVSHHHCDYNHATVLPLCSCPHCTTLHTLVTSLRHDISYGCPYTYRTTSYQSPKSMVKFSPSSWTFNSHRCYDSLPTRRNRRRSSPISRKEDRREDTPVPSSRSPSPELTPTPQQKNFISRDTFNMERSANQEKPVVKRKHSRRGGPRTIHIDVYCSTSSSSDESEKSHNSDSTLEEDGGPVEEPSPTRPLVALGSKKKHYKNDFKLQSRSLARVTGARKRGPLPDESYQSPLAEGKYRSSGAFITDHPLSLCSSPSTPIERPVSSPPQVNVDRYSEGARSKNYGSVPRNILDIPLPAPAKPKSLRISPHVPRMKETRKLDYLNENNRPNLIDLTSTPVDEFRGVASRSESNLTSLQAAFAGLNTSDDEIECQNDDIFIRPWRSPKIERQKFLTKEMEERYEAKIQSRRNDDANLTSSDVLKTPTEVSELAKMSVFRDFSEEELEVISKSLTRRESERSVASRKSSSTLSRHSSFRLHKSPSPASQESGGSFKYKSENPREIAIKNLSEEAQKFLEELKRDSSNGSFKRANSGVKEASWDVKRISELDEENSAFVCPVEEAVGAVGRQGSSSPCTTPASPVKRKTDGRQSTGSRLINVGVFKRLDRFPFSTYTYPGPYQSQPSISLSDDDRRFVRPSLFGNTLKASRRHGIHFGPPRNPQCSCVSCRVWRLNQTNARDLSPPRPRSQSLSDISPRSSPSSVSSQTKHL